MHDEVYADAVGDLTVTGGIVRLDLVSLSPGAQRAGVADLSISGPNS